MISAIRKMIIARMVSLRSSSSWFFSLSCIFILLQNPSVNGSENLLCPKKAVIDLTEEEPDFFGSYNKSGVVFGPETTWTIDARRFGCLCGSKTCLSMCCSLGAARIEGSCVNGADDNSSALFGITKFLDHWNFHGPKETDFYTFADDPCAVGWMASSVLEDFRILLNGSIYSAEFDGGSLSDFEQYCLFREPESSIYLAKVCRPMTCAVYDVFCLIICIVVLLIIFVCFTVVPELRNLHGVIFRSYIITYVGMYTCSLIAQFVIGSRTYAEWYSIAVFIGHFAAMSCAFWLNVMSFDIWRTFRSLRSMETRTKERDTKKFIWYGIWAWIIPAILVTSCVAIMRYVPYFRNDTVGETLKQWSTVGLIITIYVCNACMYTSTALKIRQHNKDTAHLTDSVNKHHKVNKQWFNLHVKLFLIMGGHMVMWAFWIAWPTGIMTRLLLTLEVTQNFFIFYIFLCKDNVKRSLQKRFSEILSSLNFSVQNSSKLSASTSDES